MVVSELTDSSDEDMNESSISYAEMENSSTSINNRRLGSSLDEFVDDPSSQPVTVYLQVWSLTLMNI